MPPLSNGRHERFAQEVAAGKSQTEAAIIAGFSVKSAATHTSRLAKKGEVQARITELQEAIAASMLVDATKLHRRWSEMFDADIADIIEPDTDNTRMRLKPIHQWPKIWRQMMSGVDVKELFEHSKDGEASSWDKIGELVKMKFVDQLKLGELIAKHKAVDAFAGEKQEHVHLHLHQEIQTRLLRAREIAVGGEQPQDVVNGVKPQQLVGRAS